MISRVPGSAREANNLVDHHDNLVKVAFEDARVQRLQNEGEAMLNSLQREEAHIGHSDDYRYGEFKFFTFLCSGGRGALSVCPIPCVPSHTKTFSLIVGASVSLVSIILI